MDTNLLPFSAEQSRIVRLLVERVDVDVDGLRIRLRTEGLSRMVDELAVGDERRAA